MDYISSYETLHKAERGYGAGSRHLDYVATLLSILKARRILDFGCGKGVLADQLNGLGFECDKHDPAIPEYSKLKDDVTYDCVINTDVLEHVPEKYLDEVIGNIAGLADFAVIIPHLGLAKTILPDGSNAHCTILSPEEWARWLSRHYKFVRMFPHVSPKHQIFLCSRTEVGPEFDIIMTILHQNKQMLEQIGKTTCRARLRKFLALIVGRKRAARIIK